MSDDATMSDGDGYETPGASDEMSMEDMEAWRKIFNPESPSSESDGEICTW